VLTSNGYVLDDQPRRLGRLEPVPSADRTSRNALAERLHDHGYLLLKGQVDPELIRAFRRYYFTVLAPSGLVADDREPVDGIAGPTDRLDLAGLRSRLFRTVVPGAEYHALCTTPQVRNWFRWYLGGEVHLHRRKIIRHTRPNEHAETRTMGVGAATQAHYDLLYLREGSDHVLSMWIPLGDCPTSLGGLVYLEGSHRWVQDEERVTSGKRPAASITADLPGLARAHDARWLYADYEVGDVVVHTAHLVHAALDNVDPGGRLRLSTDIRYQLAEERIDPRWQNHWHDEDGL
jgi:ectoine hydroxylase-related dioxygenase (phytanoyl-CoA dioxygenase family)